MFSEWLFLPQAAAQYLADPMVWVFLLLGTVCGFFVGVMPGLGPTMGMALSLGIIFKLEAGQGMALLIGIFVAAIGSGGITASLLNIPGTAAAATCMDGYALTRQGRSREAVGYSVVSSVIGTIAATVLIFLIQPFITAIALKFGDWETFLFCLFGLLVCGSLSGESKTRGWIAALGGCLVSMCGADGVQSVLRFTFGRPELLSGVDSVVAMLGFLVLSGVVVNNGIVFVDSVNQLRLEGMEKRDAIVETGRRRIRPILMTALTTILGLFTTALAVGQGADLLQPMAVVIIAGLAYATLLTLFIVPALYDIFRRKELKRVELDDDRPDASDPAPQQP